MRMASVVKLMLFPGIRFVGLTWFYVSNRQKTFRACRHHVPAQRPRTERKFIVDPVYKTETCWTPYIDVVADPMTFVFRLDVERFSFHSTGQKVHASALQNTWALCIGLVSAAPNVTCGPGVQWIREGGLPQRQRVRDSNLHQGLLRWRLTRIRELCENSSWATKNFNESPETSKQLGSSNSSASAK